MCRPSTLNNTLLRSSHTETRQPSWDHHTRHTSLLLLLLVAVGSTWWCLQVVESASGCNHQTVHRVATKQETPATPGCSPTSHPSSSVFPLHNSHHHHWCDDKSQQSRRQCGWCWCAHIDRRWCGRTASQLVVLVLNRRMLPSSLDMLTTRSAVALMMWV